MGHLSLKDYKVFDIDIRLDIQFGLVSSTRRKAFQICFIPYLHTSIYTIFPAFIVLEFLISEEYGAISHEKPQYARSKC